MGTKSRNAGSGGSEADAAAGADPFQGARALPTPECSWVRPGRGGGDGGYLAAFDERFRADYKVLFDFLALTGVAGANRRTGTLLLFAEDGKWKACVSDREDGYYAFCSSDTVTGLLEALNKALEKGQLDWRVSRSSRR